MATLQINGATIEDIAGQVEFAAPSLPSTRRAVAAYTRAINDGTASGYPLGDFEGTPVPQPRPKAARAASVWLGVPQIRLTLLQQLALDRAS